MLLILLSLPALVLGAAGSSTAGAASPVTIGPTDDGSVPLVTGTSCSFGGAGCAVPAAPEATYQVTSPVANGGNLAIGDTFTVEWQVYEPGGYSASPTAGPVLTWTLPAPSGTQIDGPVSTSSTGLQSPTAGQGSVAGAGACTSSTCATRTTAPGLQQINGASFGGSPYTLPQPVGALTTVWNESSGPTVGTDGLYLDLTFTAKVTTPGPVTLGGFPALTATGLTSVAVAPPGGVSFTAVDSNPPTVTDQQFTVSAGTSETLHVLATATVGAFPIDPTTVTVVTAPQFGTATVNTDGTINYTNTSSSSLTDAFTFTVADSLGGVSKPATVSLTMALPLVVTSASNLSPGLILQQPVAVPTVVLGSSLGGSPCAGPITLTGQAQIACGQLTPVTVLNDGGADAGWTLTGQVSDFLDPTVNGPTTCDTPASVSNHCIPGGDLGWSPTASVVAPVAGYAAQVSSGATLPAPAPVPSGTTPSPVTGLGSVPQVLCQAPANASQGMFTCGAGLSLAVPASAAEPISPGYQATITLTLSY